MGEPCHLAPRWRPIAIISVEWWKPMIVEGMSKKLLEQDANTIEENREWTLGNMVSLCRSILVKNNLCAWFSTYFAHNINLKHLELMEHLAFHSSFFSSMLLFGKVMANDRKKITRSPVESALKITLPQVTSNIRIPSRILALILASYAIANPYHPRMVYLPTFYVCLG